MHPFFVWIRVQFRDLYLGLVQTDGRFSSTKFFSSVAYGTATWVIIHQQLNGALGTEMMLAYLGTVAGHNILLRKWGTAKETANASE